MNMKKSLVKFIVIFVIIIASIGYSVSFAIIPSTDIATTDDSSGGNNPPTSTTKYYSNSWSHKTVNGVKYHYRALSTTKTSHTSSDEAACSGGTATCVDEAECSTCGSSYGGVDSDNHNWPSSWTAKSNRNAALSFVFKWLWRNTNTKL